MGPIARRLSILATLAILQVSSQQTVTQYLVSNYVPHAPIQPPRPTIPVPVYPNVIAYGPAKPAAPKAPIPKPQAPSGSIDSNVLNNLAIALQLLIISNLMNMPTVDKDSSSMDLPLPKAKLNSLNVVKNDATIPLQSLVELLSKSSTPQLPKSIYYEMPKPVLYETRLPSASYVGTPQVIDPVVAAARPSRQGMMLMSPYDALGTIGESVPNLAYTKRDFQSPYASILATEGYTDLFSIANLF